MAKCLFCMALVSHLDVSVVIVNLNDFFFVNWSKVEIKYELDLIKNLRQKFEILP